jgi:RalA-binding protein 1
MLPDTHPDHLQLLRLQLEYQELTNWKMLLQKRINAERGEMVRLKNIWTTIETNMMTRNNNNETTEYPIVTADMENLVGHYQRENVMLEAKKRILANDIFEENAALIQLQVDYALQHLKLN